MIITSETKIVTSIENYHHCREIAEPIPKPCPWCGSRGGMAPTEYRVGRRPKGDGRPHQGKGKAQGKKQHIVQIISHKKRQPLISVNRSRKTWTGFLLFALFLLSQTASADVIVGATVVNDQPRLIDFTANLLFIDHEERFSEENIIRCFNQDETRTTFLFTLEDRNTIEDILLNGPPAYLVEEDYSGESYLRSVFADSTIHAVNGTDGIFSASSHFLWDVDEAGMDDYYFIILTNDSQGEKNILAEEFLIMIQDCEAEIFKELASNGSISRMDSFGVFIDFLSQEDTKGQVYIRTSEKCIYPSSRAMSGCLSVFSTPRFGSAVDSMQIELSYSNILKKDEKYLSLEFWDGDRWTPVDGMTIDKKSKVIKGLGHSFGTYAILGKETCQENWICGRWSSCRSPGVMGRICEDINKCGTVKEKPITEKQCIYTPQGKRGETESEPEISYDPIIPEVTLPFDKDILFDINVELLEGEIIQRDILMLKVTLINFGDPGKVDVSLVYTILNESGSVLRIEEGRSLETQTEFLKELDIAGLSDGRYSLIVDLTYETQTEPAQAKQEFIIDRLGDGFRVIWAVVIGILIAILICIFIIHHTHRSHGPPPDNKKH